VSIKMDEPTKENIIENEDPVLAPQLYMRNPEQGAGTAQAVGTMGSGKTTLLIRTVIKIMEAKDWRGERLVSRVTNKEDPSAENMQSILDRVRAEKLFWRGQISCQWARIPEEVPKIVWISDSLDLEFTVDRGGFTEQKKRFSTVEELVDSADPQSVNVVYTENALKLIDLVRYLVFDKPYTSWASVFCDEWEDIAPLNMPSPYREHVNRLKNALKEARKRRVSFYGATQQRSEIDWQCLNKVMYWLFLKGAKPPGDSRVWQRAIDGLGMGEAFFTDRSLFERIKFDNYPPVRNVNVRSGMPDAWALEELTLEEGSE